MLPFSIMFSDAQVLPFWTVIYTMAEALALPIMLGRTGAPCQPLSWWVSPVRPPNRTCGSHRIRLSTGSCRWCG